MKFTDAGPAEIIRSSQKDEYYMNYLRRQVADCVQRLLGPGIWVKWRHDLDLLADLGYFCLTTISGLQTLGEEYVNIVQVDKTKRNIPTSLRRCLLVLLHVCTPYLLNRLLKYCQSWLSRQPTIQTEHKARLLKCISVIRYTISVVHRCHLALFYIQGVFYHVAKRFSGVHYLLVRSGLGTPEGAPSFRWLGYFSLIQLTTALVQQGLKYARGNLDIGENTIDDTRSSSEFVAPSLRCPLCLEARLQSTVMPCGHVFCWKCIAEWINSKNECPLCRDKFGMSRLVVLQNYDPR